MYYIFFLENDAAILDCIQWLKNNIEPWAEVLSKWKLTAEARMQLISKFNSIEQILQEFIILKQPLAYSLVFFLS